MSIPVTCPECGAMNKVNDSLAGRKVRCPECDTAVDVPVQQAVAPAAPPPLPSESPAEEPPAPSEPEPTAPTAAKPPTQPTSPIDSAAALQPSAASNALDLDDDDDEEVFKRTEREEEELDMTPMVDVTFLLLIFFMVTAAFSLQKSIKMPRQQTDAPSTTVVEPEDDEMESVEVQIDERGSFLVMAPDWEQETPGKQNLITALKRAKEGIDQMRLAIKVHEQCKLQFLVDAMDAGTIANYSETQVTQVEDF